MSSSTSSSKRGATVSGAGFVVVVFTIAIALLAGLEFSLRQFRVLLSERDAKYVLRVLEEPGKSVIIGDSHVLPVRVSKDWVRLARAGLAPSEAARVLAARLKFTGIDRVIIESGPQILMAERQNEFRALQPETLARQIFPVPVMVLEPSFLNSALQVTLANLPAFVSDADASEDEEKSSHSVPQKIAMLRAIQQNPVAGFESSFAWRKHWEMVERLTDAGVDVCLVQTPVMQVYLKAAGSGEGMRYFPALEALSKEAERRGVRYIKANTLEHKYRDDLFSNSDHLNRRGGRIFAREIESICFPNA